ncbi:hypothetical protein J6590_010547 [Homalodisca vitripennis]|nr:hypothetical protein J6590_010547 [Homalodisca vitripennis]
MDMHYMHPCGCRGLRLCHKLQTSVLLRATLALFVFHSILLRKFRDLSSRSPSTRTSSTFTNDLIATVSSDRKLLWNNNGHGRDFILESEDCSASLSCTRKPLDVPVTLLVQGMGVSRNITRGDWS